MSVYKFAYFIVLPDGRMYSAIEHEPLPLDDVSQAFSVVITGTGQRYSDTLYNGDPQGLTPFSQLFGLAMQQPVAEPDYAKIIDILQEALASSLPDTTGKRQVPDIQVNIRAQVRCIL